MKRRLGLGAVLLLALFGLGAWWSIGRVESDLTAKAEVVVAGTEVEVRFEGRDAYLSGDVDAVAAISPEIEAIEGVRVVNHEPPAKPPANPTDQRRHEPPDPAPATTASTLAGTMLGGRSTSSVEGPVPNVGLTVEDGVVALDGLVPGEVHRRSLEGEAARSLVVRDVVSNLVVTDTQSTVETDARIAIFATLTRLLADNTIQARANLVADDLTIGGVAKSELGVSDVETAAAVAAAAGLRVTNDLAVADLDADEEMAFLQADLDAIASRTTFEYNRGGLPDATRESLDAAVLSLRHFPTPNVQVGGHTDSSGPAGRNRALSEQRASIVVAHLIAQGIAAERLSAIGFGETTPVADNSTAAGQAANRRVEFEVLPG